MSGVERRRIGYGGAMSENSNEPGTPEVGLIADDELPEDLQPTDDNPLAQDTSDSPSDGGGRDGDATNASRSAEPEVEGMPDMDEPGPS